MTIFRNPIENSTKMVYNITRKKKYKKDKGNLPGKNNEQICIC